MKDYSTKINHKLYFFIIKNILLKGVQGASKIWCGYHVL